MPAGRPTDYKPEFVAIAEAMCKLGATDGDLAREFGVTITTVRRWAARHEEFCSAIKAGKAVADEKVERSLYQRAIGWEHDATKIFMPAGAEEPVVVDYVERYAPETAAAIFWLKNRKRDTWRDKIDHGHEGDLPISVTINRFTDDADEA